MSETHPVQRFLLVLNAFGWLAVLVGGAFLFVSDASPWNVGFRDPAASPAVETPRSRDGHPPAPLAVRPTAERRGGAYPAPAAEDAPAVSIEPSPRGTGLADEGGKSALTPPEQTATAGSPLLEQQATLAEDERATIDLFKLASPSVVHITTHQVARDFFSMN